MAGYSWDKDVWLKNLATASLVAGKWQATDPELVKSGAVARVIDTITDLYDDAQVACEVFNLHAPSNRQVRVLQLTATGQNNVQAGFVLLQGRHQLKLAYIPHRLESTLIATRGFQHGVLPMHQFIPQLDALGSVLWVMDKSALLTNEMIIKQLFEDLTRATFEIEGR